MLGFVGSQTSFMATLPPELAPTIQRPIDENIAGIGYNPIYSIRQINLMMFRIINYVAHNFVTVTDVWLRPL